MYLGITYFNYNIFLIARIYTIGEQCDANKVHKQDKAHHNDEESGH